VLRVNSEKKRDSLMMKSNSTTMISDVKLSSSFDTSTMKKSVSDVTYLADGKNEDREEEKGGKTPTLSNGSQRVDAVQLPGILIKHKRRQILTPRRLTQMIYSTAVLI